MAVDPGFSENEPQVISTPLHHVLGADIYQLPDTFRLA